MPRSKYLETYLAETASGHIITPGTFLAARLHGKAKENAGRYRQALMRALENEPGIKQVRSTGGGVAFIRDQAPQWEARQ